MTDAVVRELAGHGLAETARWVAGLGRADLPAAALELDVEDLQRRLDAAIRERDAHAAEVGRMRDQRDHWMHEFQSLRGSMMPALLLLAVGGFVLVLWAAVR